MSTPHAWPCTRPTSPPNVKTVSRPLFLPPDNSTPDAVNMRTHLEPVNLVHITRLMIPPVQKDSLRVQPLVRKQRQGDLDGPRTSIDKVSVEDDGVVFGRRGEDGQEVAEVVELLRWEIVTGVSARCAAKKFQSGQLEHGWMTHPMRISDDIALDPLVKGDLYQTLFPIQRLFATEDDLPYDPLWQLSPILERLDHPFHKLLRRRVPLPLFVVLW